MGLRDKDYWDAHYELELKNFHDEGDEGEVWFGKGLSRRIAKWIVNKTSLTLANNKVTRVLDIGCGNAFTLVTLIEQLRPMLEPDILEKNLEILGLDYSKNSVDLSRKIIEKHSLASIITLEQCDFLNSEQVTSLSNGVEYDYIIDKGTYDAICLLASASDEELMRAQTNYMNSLYCFAKEGTILILASCNHTEEELLQLFTKDCSNKRNVKLQDKIETPKIQFGGIEGSQVTCLILEFS